MCSNPLVSIALCTYNGAGFLAKQLDSLLFQSYKAIEIIAVDDCSTDNTWDILQVYARKDSRLQPYKNDHNIGHTRNFEKAITLCKGDYIALSDQDDIWVEDKIKILMESVGESMLVYHDSDFINEHGERIGRSSMAQKHRMYDGESCMPIILANSIHGHAMLFDSKLKTHLFPLNEHFSHDWAIAFAAFNMGSVKFVNKILVHYRQHQNSVTDFLEQRKAAAVSKKLIGLERLGIKPSWLKYCLAFEYKKEPDLVNNACKLFLNLMDGKSKFKSFRFMMRYFDLLFYSMGNKHRGFFSRINFVRKLCYT